MKNLFAITALTAFTALSSAALAASVDVDSIDADQEGTTTIQIKKSKNEDSKTTTDAKWHVEDGTQDLEGEPAATAKEARRTWKKSCEDWKKEFRADNKENKIIAMSCGAPTCGGDAGSKTCASKASFKIKTRVD